MSERTRGTVVELARYREAHAARLEAAQEARRGARDMPSAGTPRLTTRALAHRARMLRHLLAVSADR